MNNNKRNHNNHFEVHELIDDAVNNALVRRGEALVPLDEEELQSISGGTLLPFPTVDGVIFNPNPQPNPKPIVNGIVIQPRPIVNGLIVNQNS